MIMQRSVQTDKKRNIFWLYNLRKEAYKNKKNIEPTEPFFFSLRVFFSSTSNQHVTIFHQYIRILHNLIYSSQEYPILIGCQW